MSHENHQEATAGLDEEELEMKKNQMKRNLRFIVSITAILLLASSAAQGEGLSPTTAALSAGPSARAYQQLTYDQGADRVVMMGGLEGAASGWDQSSEVWAFAPDAERWDLVGSLEQGPGDVDSMVYDAGAGKVIVFLGSRFNPDGNHPWFPIDVVSETWAYDLSSNTWENCNPGPAKPKKGLLGTRMAYDSESGVVILHGGIDVTSFQLSDATWAYDYASNTWTNMRPAGGPTARNYHGLTYDAGADRVLSIAGYDSTYTVTNDVFAYDYNNNVWTQLDSGDAPARDYVSAQYIPSADRVILFGGATYADTDPGLIDPIPNNDTWEFDYFSNTWTLLQPTKSPSPRIWHGMAATERGLVLFGGGDSREVVNDETWLFNAKSQQWKKEGAARRRR